jgi:hypothetical protein
MRKPRKKLELVRGGGNRSKPPRQNDEPGIYESQIHAPGEHWYTILMPSGAAGIVHVPDEFWDEDFCARLWKQFFRRARSLRVIP